MKNKYVQKLIKWVIIKLSGQLTDPGMLRKMNYELYEQECKIHFKKFKDNMHKAALGESGIYINYKPPFGAL